MNKEENKNEKEDERIEKKNNRKNLIIRLLIITVLLVIIMFFISITKKIIIINDMEGKIQEYIDSDDFYEKIYEAGNEKARTAEFYNKGDKAKLIVNQYTEANGERKIIQCFNNDKINTYMETENSKVAILDSDGVPGRVQILNYLYHENIGELLYMALTFSIEDETYNNIDCYKISKGKYFEIYIDKNTGLVKKAINGTVVREEDGKDIDIDLEYEYKFNMVTDNDLEEPDINQYEVQENSNVLTYEEVQEEEKEV